MFFNMLLTLVLTLAISATADNSVGDTASEINHGQLMVDWLRNRGGFFSPKLEIRRADPLDPTSYFAMFSKEDIQSEEVLITIPRDCLIDTGIDPFDPEDRDSFQCQTIHNLVSEMRKGEESSHAPYVNYLLAQPRGQITNTWSDAGVELFNEVLIPRETEDEDYEGSTLLPPYSTSKWMEDEWVTECKGESDPLELHAASMLLQRSWDDVLIPVFDYMNHRNGKWLNTDSNSVHGPEPISVFAIRKIEAGEQIYTTYNTCHDCGNRALDYGTPELLRDYGFVEQYPQRWIFHNEELGFVVDEVLDEEGVSNGDIEVTDWILEDPDETDVDFLLFLLEEQFRVPDDLLAERSEDVPQSEWDKIVAYQKAVVRAAEAGLVAMRKLGLQKGSSEL